MRDRADVILVSLELASSRSQAKLLIKEGVVFSRGALVTKAGSEIDDFDVEVRKSNIYVGRGAHKLEEALAKFSIEVAGLVVADIGASTGGFTDLVLKKGAKRVYAIDVGHKQLHHSLIGDDRVINMEKTNIRDLAHLSELVDLAVVDLSYISLKLVAQKVFSLVRDGGEVIMLIKPQFEIGKDRIKKTGIVSSKKDRLFVLEDIYSWFKDQSLFIKGIIKSPISGKTGNVEYLFYFHKNLDQHKIAFDMLRNIV